MEMRNQKLDEKASKAMSEWVVWVLGWRTRQRLQMSLQSKTMKVAAALATTNICHLPTLGISLSSITTPSVLGGRRRLELWCNSVVGFWNNVWRAGNETRTKKHQQQSLCVKRANDPLWKITNGGSSGRRRRQRRKETIHTDKMSIVSF